MRSSFQLARLRQELRPFRLHWFARLRSTNDHAAVLRRRGTLFAPAVVLTGHQTAGRGRGANVWHSGRGCLTVTFVLPLDERIGAHRVPLIAGLAVRNAAAELTGSDAIRLKWPNDLLYDGRKLGGLLCERTQRADLVGLGLNVNLNDAEFPPELRGKMCSLQEIAGQPLDLTGVLSTVATHLRQVLSRGAERPFAQLLQEYDAHHALIGRMVSIVGPDSEPPLSGRCEGLDAMGRLIVKNPSGRHLVIAGHVVMR